MASNIPRDTITADCRNNIVNIGKLNADKIEDREMILTIEKLRNQINTVKPKTMLNPGILKAKPKSTPKVVATPLPPLNLKNIVQLCPNMHPNPIAINMFCACAKSSCFVKTSPSKTTGKKPFNISRNNTVIPQPLPKILNALVAPTFPEPNLRISTPFNKRTKIYAVGIEPNK